MRAKADEDAQLTGGAADAKAQEIVEEGERRRADVERVISELEARRDAAIQELHRLRPELSLTIGTHTSAAMREQPQLDDEAEPATKA